MTEFLLKLPWPPTVLSPNARKDRRHTTAVRNGYKTACFYATKEAGAVITADAHLSIQFYPPDARKRDLDNLLGSIKYGLDGVALAAGVDDYGWSFSIQRCDPVKGGAVLIHVREPAVQIIELRGEIQ